MDRVEKALLEVDRSLQRMGEIHRMAEVTIASLRETRKQLMEIHPGNPAFNRGRHLRAYANARVRPWNQ